MASTLDPDALYACLLLCMALSGAATVRLARVRVRVRVRVRASTERRSHGTLAPVRALFRAGVRVNPACHRMHTSCNRAPPACNCTCAQVGFIGLALNPNPDPNPIPNPIPNPNPNPYQVGFIGLALNLVVHIGAPVPEAYTVGGVEWLTQGVR